MSVRRLGLGPSLGWATAAILVALCGHLVSSAPVTYQSLSASATDCLKEASLSIFPVVRFIATNYIAHAFTVKLSPGFGLFYLVMFSVMSLFFPYFGLVEAIRNIEQLAYFAGSDLDTATKAGALCVLARTGRWRPRPGDKAWCWSTSHPAEETEGSGEFTLTSHKGLGLEHLPRHFLKWHGVCHPPPNGHPQAGKANDNNKGCLAFLSWLFEDEDEPANLKDEYMLVRLPPYYEVKWNLERPKMDPQAQELKWNPEYEKKDHKIEETKYNNKLTWMERIMSRSGKGRGGGGEETRQLSQYDLGISSSLPFVKGIVALFQLYSVFSYIVAEKNGNRINDYAAFQLTLIPYGLMSVVNILCGFVTPNYGAVYMVNSTIMEEARRRGWTFDGTVGELCEETQEVCRKKKGTEEVLHAGFRAAFTGKTVARSSKVTNPPLGDNGVKKGEMGTDLSPKVGGGEITVVEPNAGVEEKEEFSFKVVVGEGKMEPNFKIVAGERTKWNPIPWSYVLDEVKRIFFRALSETLLFRFFILHDQDPGEDYATSLFPREGKKGRNIVIPPIGNPTYRKVGWRFHLTLLLSDIFVLGSLALPHVLTWYLTGYKAPTVGKWNGVVFQAWLVLGQLSPLPGRVTWGYIQSRQRGRLQRDIFYAAIICCMAAWSLPALAGFVLVGKERYHHPDARTPYNLDCVRSYLNSTSNNVN